METNLQPPPPAAAGTVPTAATNLRSTSSVVMTNSPSHSNAPMASVNGGGTGVYRTQRRASQPCIATSSSSASVGGGAGSSKSRGISPRSATPISAAASASVCGQPTSCPTSSSHHHHYHRSSNHTGVSKSSRVRSRSTADRGSRERPREREPTAPSGSSFISEKLPPSSSSSSSSVTAHHHPPIQSSEKLLNHQQFSSSGGRLIMAVANSSGSASNTKSTAAGLPSSLQFREHLRDPSPAPVSHYSKQSHCSNSAGTIGATVTHSSSGSSTIDSSKHGTVQPFSSGCSVNTDTASTSGRVVPRRHRSVTPPPSFPSTECSTAHHGTSSSSSSRHLYPIQRHAASRHHSHHHQPTQVVPSSSSYLSAVEDIPGNSLHIMKTSSCSLARGRTSSSSSSCSLSRQISTLSLSAEVAAATAALNGGGPGGSCGGSPQAADISPTGSAVSSTTTLRSTVTTASTGSTTTAVTNTHYRPLHHQQYPPNMPSVVHRHPSPSPSIHAMMHYHHHHHHPNSGQQLSSTALPPPSSSGSSSLHDPTGVPSPSSTATVERRDVSPGAAASSSSTTSQQQQQQQRSSRHEERLQNFRRISSKQTCVCAASSYMARRQLLLDHDKLKIKEDKMKLLQDFQMLASKRDSLMAKETEIFALHEEAKAQNRENSEREMALTKKEDQLVHNWQEWEVRSKEVHRKTEELNALESERHLQKKQMDQEKSLLKEEADRLEHLKRELESESKIQQQKGLKLKEQLLQLQEDGKQLELQEETYQTHLHILEGQQNRLAEEKEEFNQLKIAENQRFSAELRKLEEQQRELAEQKRLASEAASKARELREELTLKLAEAAEDADSLQREKTEFLEAKQKSEKDMVDREAVLENDQIALIKARSNFETFKVTEKNSLHEERQLFEKFHKEQRGELERNQSKLTQEQKDFYEWMTTERRNFEEALAEKERQMEEAMKKKQLEFEREKEEVVKSMEAQRKELVEREENAKLAVLECESRLDHVQEKEAAVAHSQTELQQAQEEIEHERSELRMQKQEVSAKQNQLQSREEDVARHEYRLTMMRSEIKEMKLQNEQKIQELDNTKKELASLDDRIKAREAECDKHEAQLEQLQFEKEMLQLEKTAYEAHKSDLRMEYDAKHSAIEASGRSLQHLRDELSNEQRSLKLREKELLLAERVFKSRMQQDHNRVKRSPLTLALSKNGQSTKKASLLLGEPAASLSSSVATEPVASISHLLSSSLQPSSVRNGASLQHSSSSSLPHAPTGHSSLPFRGGRNFASLPSPKKSIATSSTSSLSSLPCSPFHQFGDTHRTPPSGSHPYSDIRIPPTYSLDEGDSSAPSRDLLPSPQPQSFNSHQETLSQESDDFPSQDAPHEVRVSHTPRHIGSSVANVDFPSYPLYLQQRPRARTPPAASIVSSSSGRDGHPLMSTRPLVRKSFEREGELIEEGRTPSAPSRYRYRKQMLHSNEENVFFANAATGNDENYFAQGGPPGEGVYFGNFEEDLEDGDGELFNFLMNSSSRRKGLRREDREKGLANGEKDETGHWSTTISTTGGAQSTTDEIHAEDDDDLPPYPSLSKFECFTIVQDLHKEKSEEEQQESSHERVREISAEERGVPERGRSVALENENESKQKESLQVVGQVSFCPSVSKQFQGSERTKDLLNLKITHGDKADGMWQDNLREKQNQPTRPGEGQNVKQNEKAQKGLIAKESVSCEPTTSPAIDKMNGTTIMTITNLQKSTQERPPIPLAPLSLPSGSIGKSRISDSDGSSSIFNSNSMDVYPAYGSVVWLGESQVETEGDNSPLLCPLSMQLMEDEGAENGDMVSMEKEKMEEEVEQLPLPLNEDKESKSPMEMFGQEKKEIAVEQSEILQAKPFGRADDRRSPIAEYLEDGQLCEEIISSQKVGKEETNKAESSMRRPFLSIIRSKSVVGNDKEREDLAIEEPRRRARVLGSTTLTRASSMEERRDTTKDKDSQTEMKSTRRKERVIDDLDGSKLVLSLSEYLENGSTSQSAISQSMISHRKMFQGGSLSIEESQGLGDNGGGIGTPQRLAGIRQNSSSGSGAGSMGASIPGRSSVLSCLSAFDPLDSEDEERLREKEELALYDEDVGRFLNSNYSMEEPCRQSENGVHFEESLFGLSSNSRQGGTDGDDLNCCNRDGISRKAMVLELSMSCDEKDKQDRAAGSDRFLDSSLSLSLSQTNNTVEEGEEDEFDRPRQVEPNCFAWSTSEAPVPSAAQEEEEEEEAQSRRRKKEHFGEGQECEEEEDKGRKGDKQLSVFSFENEPRKAMMIVEDNGREENVNLMNAPK